MKRYSTRYLGFMMVNIMLWRCLRSYIHILWTVRFQMKKRIFLISKLRFGTIKVYVLNGRVHTNVIIGVYFYNILTPICLQSYFKCLLFFFLLLCFDNVTIEMFPTTNLDFIDWIKPSYAQLLIHIFSKKCHRSCTEGKKASVTAA